MDGTARMNAFAQAWLAALEARGIVCDAARRQRIAHAAPLLERMRQRVRDWRASDDEFTARFDTHADVGCTPEPGREG